MSTIEIQYCELCGDPMPTGEEMFKYHGYSGPCPKPPLVEPQAPEVEVWGIHHPQIGFRFSGPCVSTDIEDAITWANAENICDQTDKWKARKFKLSVHQPPLDAGCSHAAAQHLAIIIRSLEK